MTKNEIIKMAREAGLFTHKEVQPELLAFAALIATAEREACAKVCDELDVNYVEKRLIAYHHAYLIRQRGNK